VAHFAVSAVGRDRPGIVAAIADALFELEGNVEDSRMTILRGHFVVMLIVSLPEGRDRAELEGRLGPVGQDLGLEALTVSAVDELGHTAGADPTHVITVYGADHPGIVRSVAAALAEREVNITDLQTQLSGSGKSALYVMLLEVEIPEDGAGELQTALESVAEGAAVEVALSELDAEAL
jgi:glycine cleavage system transcriptional repressor